MESRQYTKQFELYSFPGEVKSFKFLYTLAFDYRKGLDILIPSYCEEISSTDDVSLIIKIYIPYWISQENFSDLISSYIPDKENNPHIHIMIEDAPREDLLYIQASIAMFLLKGPVDREYHRWSLWRWENQLYPLIRKRLQNGWMIKIVLFKKVMIFLN